MCGILGRSRKGDGVMLSCYKNLLYGAIPKLWNGMQETNERVNQTMQIDRYGMNSSIRRRVSQVVV